METVGVDIFRYMDTFSEIGRLEDRVYTGPMIRKEVTELIRIATKVSGHTFFDYLHRYDHSKPKVRDQLSYLYLCILDEVSSLLPSLDRITVDEVVCHEFRDMAGVTYRYKQSSDLLQRWLRTRNEEYPIHPEARKLIDEFFREYPPLRLSSHL